MVSRRGRGHNDTGQRGGSGRCSWEFLSSIYLRPPASVESAAGAVSGTGHLQGFDVRLAEELACGEVTAGAAADEVGQMVGRNAGAGFAQGQVARANDAAGGN